MPYSTPVFWRRNGGASVLLQPLAWLYRAGSIVREKLSVAEKIPVPVICVGNATVGGAGKTPTVLALQELLAARNVRIFALSKGYGGVLSGPVSVDTAEHTPAQVGDEPLLLARKMPTIVAKDRVAGAFFAVQQGAEAIMMDDGLQNPLIRKSCAFMVVDAAYGFGNGKIFPAGPLREPVERALARADAVIAIGGDIQVEGKPVITARFVVPDAVMAQLEAARVLAFAGIGRPEKFAATLAECGAEVVECASFADHYFYTEDDMERLRARAQSLSARLVTTEKDAVRLTAKWRERVLSVPVTLQFDAPEQVKEILERALAG